MSNIPSPEEQRKNIKNIERDPFTIGEKVCPISSEWFHNWKKCVNYDDENEPFSTESEPINNYKIIKNGKLARNLVENIDFNLIHKESYDLLLEWYSGGPTIELEVISNSKGKPVVPTQFITLVLVYISSEKLYEVHKFVKNSEIHKMARQLFDIPESSITRLVNICNSRVEFVYKDDEYFEDCPMPAKEIRILLDYQKGDGTWFSDELEESEKSNENINGLIPSYSTTYSPLFSPSYSPSYSSNSCSAVSGSAGVVGFHNIGNTCYFNSGTQCLMHTVPLIEKFVCSDEWMSDLNYTNKIGMKGELAQAFAQLANSVWSGQCGTITPSGLKGVIGRFRDTFNGFEQQDSHELIYAMLDGIHEDLNRCRIKPNVEPVEGDGTDDDEKAVEAWRRYKQINDSIIVDIFDGMFRSRLWCPNCKSTTVVFDPFRSINMPIERPHTKKKKVVYVPFDFSEKRRTLSIEFLESSVNDFNEIASVQISKKIGKTVKVKLGAQICKGIPLQWTFQAICHFDKIVVYAFEIPDFCSDSLFAPCTIDVKAREKTEGAVKIESKIGIPFIVDVTDLPDNFDEGEGKELFEKKVEERLRVLWVNENDKDNLLVKEKERQRKEKVRKLEEMTRKKAKEKRRKEEEMTEDEEKQEKEKNEENEENSLSDYYCQHLHRITNTIEGVFYRKFDLFPPLNVTFSNYTQKVGVTFKTIRTSKNSPDDFIKKPHRANSSFICALAIIHLNICNPDLMIRSLFSNIETVTENSEEEASSLTLSSCFSYFSTADVLDERNQWYCPKCKQFVCAEKKLDIWQVPQILIIQLKRFYGSGFTARKLDSFVDFPEILDMKQYIIGPQKNEDEVKYRLYAVSNQFGSLYGGHYTANARVRDPREPGEDKGWYSFNDSLVSKSSESSAHSSAAYVLFYERINQ